MQKLNKQLVITRDDYHILTSILNASWAKTQFDRKNTEELRAELKRAKLVNIDDFPQDIVRLNSKVTIKAEDKNEIIELTLVTPDKANIKEKKISILAPIGTALIGFSRGQKVNWQVPAGKKTFTILEVVNQVE